MKGQSGGAYALFPSRRRDSGRSHHARAKSVAFAIFAPVGKPSVGQDGRANRPRIVEARGERSEWQNRRERFRTREGRREARAWGGDGLGLYNPYDLCVAASSGLNRSLKSSNAVRNRYVPRGLQGGMALSQALRKSGLRTMRRGSRRPGWI